MHCNPAGSGREPEVSARSRLDLAAMTKLKRRSQYWAEIQIEANGRQVLLRHRVVTHTVFKRSAICGRGIPAAWTAASSSAS